MAPRFRRGIRDGLWKAALCADASTTAGLIRESLDELGYKYTRDMAHKPFTKFMVIMPWPQFAYVFQFRVRFPGSFIVNAYDTQPTTAGKVHLLEVNGIDGTNMKAVVRLMRTFRRKLGRRPWDFDRGERMRTGYMLGEFTSSERRWHALGVV